MKNRISLLIALLTLVAISAPAVAEAGYKSQFLGVCQKCFRDIVAYYRPVKCDDGSTQWMWVTQTHKHCTPACKGKKKKRSFFDSPMMNPANKKPSRDDMDYWWYHFGPPGFF